MDTYINILVIRVIYELYISIDDIIYIPRPHGTFSITVVWVYLYIMGNNKNDDQHHHHHHFLRHLGLPRRSLLQVRANLRVLPFFIVGV